MWNEIKSLTKLQLMNTWGLNQMRYGKDPKQKKRSTLQIIAYGVLGIVMSFYIASSVYGYIVIGEGDFVFPFLVLLISILTLLLTVYKTGNVLFNMKTYEMMITLPVSTTTIVISRFLSMYLQTVGITALVIVPTTIVCGIFMEVSILFYILMILGIVIIPLLPMAISTVIGAIITAISARMKHKSLVAVVLSIATVGAILSIPMLLSSSRIIDLETSTISVNLIKDVIHAVKDQLYVIYPLAHMFTLGVIDNDVLSYALFTLISGSAFIIMIALVQWKFQEISSALFTHKAIPQYKLQELPTQSVYKALYYRELKLYFSSSVYVSNTVMGYFLMILFAFTTSFIGISKVEEIFGLTGMSNIVPCLLTIFCSFVSTTTAAISIEGKQWWIIQVLPVTSRQVMNIKILVNLTIAIPCYIIAVIILLSKIQFSLLGIFFMFVLPFVYILFSSVLGLMLNCKMPTFNWESETVAVKQGGAVLMTMLIGAVTAFIPLFLTLFLSSYWYIIMLITTLVVIIVTHYLYKKVSNIKLQTIGDK